MRLRDLQRRILWSVVLGLAVAVALVFYGDARNIGSHSARFDWRLAPAIVMLTLINYGLRFVKWQFYLPRDSGAFAAAQKVCWCSSPSFPWC